MDAGDSSSDVEEDSDGTSFKDNAPNHVRPRAKRACNTNLGILGFPKKRRKTLIHFTEQMVCSAVNNIPSSLIQPSGGELSSRERSKSSGVYNQVS
jgi:hypothetical protein